MIMSGGNIRCASGSGLGGCGWFGTTSGAFGGCGDCGGCCWAVTTVAHRITTANAAASMVLIGLTPSLIRGPSEEMIRDLWLTGSVAAAKSEQDRWVTP